MAQEIKSEKLLVKDIFSKWYRIPEYQRPYVWGTDQVNELLEDVMHAQSSNPDAEYFLGSMVLKENEKTVGNTTYVEYDLLDGQQRLTTLLLIAAVIRDMSSDTDLKNACEINISQKGNQFNNTPERIRIVFDIRQQVKKFIEDYVKISDGTSKEAELNRNVADKEVDISIKNMSNALLTIREYFNSNLDQIGDFFKYLNNKILMIYVSSKEQEDAFRLFTVMNSRGIKLRNSDILKAENLGIIKDDSKRADWAKKWEEIEAYFAEDFDNFLSHIRTILVKKKAVVSLLKEFKDNIYNPKDYDRTNKKYTDSTPLLKKGEETFVFIEKYKSNYEQLFDNDNYSLTDSFELYNYIQLMSKGFEADFWIAPLLKYYDKFKNNELINFVKKLDNKFANDWLSGNAPTARIENVNAIIQAIDDNTTPDDLFKSNALRLSTDLASRFEENIYGRRAAKYLLLKLDLIYQGHTKKFDMPDTVSIEHILPQNPPELSQWKKDFTDVEREEWTNKLGNLVLISRRKNSSQGNKDFADKKIKYFTNNIETFSNSVRIMGQKNEWKLSDLQSNQKEVIKKLKDSFGI